MDGVLEAAVVCTFTSIQLPRHHVRMAYSDSPGSIGGDECLKEAYTGQILNKAEMFWEALGQRCGQGNGGGPTFWALSSTPLLKALLEAGFGMEFKGMLNSL